MPDYVRGAWKYDKSMLMVKHILVYRALSSLKKRQRSY
jgi:hypothetical protein